MTTKGKFEKNRAAPKPRNYRNAEKAGAYKLASVTAETTINPGDTLNIRQFITGYGSIDGAKIQVYISGDIFDKESYIKHSMSPDHEIENGIKWGVVQTKFSNSEFRLMIGGINFEGLPTTSFVDCALDKTANYLISEKTSGGSAPFEYSLTTKKNTKPGTHYINFYLTYYNGEQWICSEEKIQFKINNAFEKFSRSLSLLAAAALIVTIAHDGVYPILDSFFELSKLIENLRHLLQ